MSQKSKRPSPILGAASAMINLASSNLVAKESRFQHSFEAAIEAIQPNPNQPRKTFSDDEITSLAATMEEHGQLQPILVRRDGTSNGQWFIVAGERRWRAAKRNGWQSILVIEHDGDPDIVSLVENLQRVDLTPVEEARGLEQLIGQKGWTQDQAADAIGKPKSDVSATLRILTLPDDLLHAVLTSKLDLPKNVLVELARVEDAVTRERLLKIARDGRLTVRVIRQIKRSASVASDGQNAQVRQGRERAISFKSLERVTNDLRAVHEQGRAVVGKDRDYLENLRLIIEELLGAKSP